MELEWIRAKDIAHMHRQPPKFVVRGFDRFDVQQGQLGDCWFVAAIASLSCPEYRHLFERVIPRGQSFQDNWYSGVFRFMFWHFGEWKQVLVDDFLPTNRGRPVFVHSSQTNEFWASLMEKAYAKLYGSYEALKGGQVIDALTDLTGGVTEHYTLRGEHANVPENIVNILFKALERLSLIGAGINGTGERALQNGLVSGHAYSVTDLRRILHGQQPVNLIRIRDPHGDSKEWRGRWSEWSPEMQQISPEDRQQLGLIQRDDGEFWMDFEDFLVNFDRLDICNLTPDAAGDVQRKWHVVEHHGRWVKSFNAGGRQSKEASHWANPQYLLKLEDTDEDEDQVCTVVVQLMQKDRRKIKQKGETFRFIGFYIYKLEKDYTVPLRKDFFEYNRDISNSGAFSNVRQVTKRLSLPPGAYVVVPCTWDEDEEADFFMRFFFEKGNVAEYCDDIPEKTEVPPPPVTPDVKDQEDNFKQFFYRVSGEDMEVNAFELKDAINEGLRKEPLHHDIGVDACRSFVCLMDVDGSGKLSFHEFQFLWHHLRSWKKIFYQHDTDNSGSMDSRELRYAINAGGYKISNKTIAQLIFKFADERGRVSLDNFLILMARLMKTFNSFHDLQRDGFATVNIQQWLEKTLTL
ncbi:hypothetical protein EGW08_007619 [Elysia chlorotica]|uniref:Calpain-3 n=1 Tax=Elysia chlorotica TaxID=188477 RepID=A0A433TSN1_ELYCH|nr:hypothetical protein EGW08_007619 [Elysia chlorotica]